MEKIIKFSLCLEIEAAFVFSKYLCLISNECTTISFFERYRYFASQDEWRKLVSVDKSNADDEVKAGYQNVFCYDSDDSVLYPNFEPALSDGTEYSDSKEVVLNEATSQKNIQEKSYAKDETRGKKYVNAKGNFGKKIKTFAWVSNKLSRTLQQDALFRNYWSLRTYNQRNLFTAVCCGVRGRALASHTDGHVFEQQCGGRLSSLTCWQL